MTVSRKWHSTVAARPVLFLPTLLCFPYVLSGHRHMCSSIIIADPIVEMDLAHQSKNVNCHFTVIYLFIAHTSRAVLILCFHFRHGTHVSASNISRQRYQSETSTLRMLPTFITYFCKLLTTTAGLLPPSAVLECESQSPIRTGQKRWSRVDCFLSEHVYRRFQMKSDIIRKTFFFPMADVGPISDVNIGSGQRYIKL